MSTNYLTLRNSNLSTFNAISINYSTLTGSTITGSTLADISRISVSTIFNSTMNASLVNYSTLVGSTISTTTFRASTIGIGTAPGTSAVTIFNGGPAPYTAGPTMTISDGAPVTTGTYGMVHLTRPSGVLDYKGYLTFIRNGSSNVQMMGYYQNSDIFGWIVTNTTTNPMNTLKGIFMDSSGNVGIGVTNPSYKLHVVGSIYADNLNMAYFNAIGGQNSGGIFFTGDLQTAAQWQISLIGGFRLGFNVNNTGTGGYSPSYTPVITFGNTGTINCGAITLNNTNVPLYLYNFGPTNYSAIYADAGGTMTFATGTAGVATRMTIAGGGAVNMTGSLTVNGNITGTEIYNNGWFRINSNNCGLYWEVAGRGITSAEGGNNQHGNICTYGTGRNGWSGYGMTSRHTVMGDGSNVGIYDNSNGWCIQFDTNRNCTISGSLTVSNSLTVSDSLTVNNGVTINGGPASGTYAWGFAFGRGSLQAINPQSYANNTGLQVNGNMFCTGMVGASDKRIKKDIIYLSSSTSLEIVSKLSPVSYCYKDTYMYSCNIQNGFIAQDVQQILPGAVTNNLKQSIPDIYQLVELISNNQFILTEPCKGTLSLSVKNKTHFDGANVISHINSIVTVDKELGNKGDKIFVYGHIVDDFHGINTDHIVSVSVGAIQELSNIIKKQEETIKIQQTQLDKLLAWATTQGYTP